MARVRIIKTEAIGEEITFHNEKGKDTIFKNRGYEITTEIKFKDSKKPTIKKAIFVFETIPDKASDLRKQIASLFGEELEQ